MFSCTLDTGGFRVYSRDVLLKGLRERCFFKGTGSPDGYGFYWHVWLDRSWSKYRKGHISFWNFLGAPLICPLIGPVFHLWFLQYFGSGFTKSGYGSRLLLNLDPVRIPYPDPDQGFFYDKGKIFSNKMHQIPYRYVFFNHYKRHSGPRTQQRTTVPYDPYRYSKQEFVSANPFESGSNPDPKHWIAGDEKNLIIRRPDPDWDVETAWTQFLWHMIPYGAGRDGVRAGDLLWITRLRRTRTRSVTPLLAK